MSSGLIMAIVPIDPIASNFAANYWRINLIAKAYVNWWLGVYAVSAKLKKSAGTPSGR